MRLLLPVILVAAMMAAAGGIYQIKLLASAKSEQVEALERTIRDEREAIRVLTAERAYLSSPAVVQAHSDRYLTLAPARTDQVIRSLDDIPLRIDPSEPVTERTSLVRATPEAKDGDAIETPPRVPAIGIAHQPADKSTAATQALRLTFHRREER